MRTRKWQQGVSQLTRKNLVCASFSHAKSVITRRRRSVPNNNAKTMHNAIELTKNGVIFVDFCVDYFRLIFRAIFRVNCYRISDGYSSLPAAANQQVDSSLNEFFVLFIQALGNREIFDEAHTQTNSQKKPARPTLRAKNSVFCYNASHFFQKFSRLN